MAIPSSKPHRYKGKPAARRFSPPPAATRLALPAAVFLAVWLLLLSKLVPFRSSRDSRSRCSDGIAPFYIHHLPDKFNADLERRCADVSGGCAQVANRGLGDPAADLGPAFYGTHQFASDKLFHERLLRHPCRSPDPSSAALFFIPFYASLYSAMAFREANHTARDRLAVELVEHLQTLPAFRRRGGRDHFVAVGRTAWDMMRSDDPNNADFGANKLLLMPELAGVSVLTVERHPWLGNNQFGVPYPSYFHPRTSSELARWQEVVRRTDRRYLFAFVGSAGGATTEKAAVRAKILEQCGKSERCRLLRCATAAECGGPAGVIRAMQDAQFCLEPPGESFTRRGIFDAVVAGCVPVFFSEHTVYTQYAWYSPPGGGRRGGEWSVYLEEEKWDRIEEELAAVPERDVARMREAVVRLMPGMVYAHPAARGDELGFLDAVEVALAALSMRAREEQLQPGELIVE